jgi:chromosome partitioning protein
MKIIAIANHKGGCGKTTTAINLSACLSLKGKKVLLIDLDPQAHASIGLNVEVDDLEKTMYDLMTDPHVNFKDIIISIDDNLDIAPSHVLLNAVEQKLAGTMDRDKQLQHKILGIRGRYDYIIIDCPPSLGLLTFNALTACRELIVPIETSCFSLHGVGKLMEAVLLIREKSHHEIKVKALATNFDRRTAFAKEVLKNIEENFGKNLFSTVIRSNVSLREAASFGQPITHYCQNSTGFMDYRSLCQDLLAGNKTIVAYKDTSAQKVQIAGDFNGWKPEQGTFNEREIDGMWFKALKLDPGAYQYRLVIDGKWQNDPNNPKYVINEYGEKNSILTVR